MLSDKIAFSESSADNGVVEITAVLTAKCSKQVDGREAALYRGSDLFQTTKERMTKEILAAIQPPKDFEDAFHEFRQAVSEMGYSAGGFSVADIMGHVSRLQERVRVK